MFQCICWGEPPVGATLETEGHCTATAIKDGPNAALRIPDKRS